MLITNEYIRRVISDVYVAVTNNIYFLEHNLDNPDSHKETMERIVKSGTRVRSCGISFIEDYYYPKKEHRFCPFAWRNAANPDEIFSQDMGDADLDYLTADWFLEVLKSDSAQWSEPFYDGYDEKTTLSAYEVPIHDPAGRVVAVLRADISLDWLTSKIKEADTTINKTIMVMASKFEMKSKSFIINHDGTYITHADGRRIMKDNFFKQLGTCEGSNVEGVINRMVNSTQDNKSQERFLVDGEECFLFYTPIKYTQWIMVTVVPCRVVDILSYLNGATVVFIILLAMLLIVIVGYYYMKTAIEPIKQLAKVADDIAAGKFDTPMPDMNHNDEICQLRDSIEGMQYMLSNYADEKRK
jgi:HAMP domain-containing protein